jgi:hypothetical protein
VWNWSKTRNTFRMGCKLMPGWLCVDVIREVRLRTKHYDKRDLLNFHIVNFPFICSNITAAALMMYTYIYLFDISELVTEYLCQKWLQIYSIYRNHTPVLSSFMIYHRLCDKSNTMRATSCARTANSSTKPEFTSGFSGVRFPWFFFSM